MDSRFARELDAWITRGPADDDDALIAERDAEDREELMAEGDEWALEDADVAASAVGS